MGDGHGDIRLCPGKGDLHRARHGLLKALVPRGSQTSHDLPKRDDS